MNRTTSLVAVAFLISIAGNWSRKKEFNATMAIGFFFAALFLAVMAEVNEKLAFAFAALLTTGVSLAYLPELLTRLGLMQTSNFFKQTNRANSLKQVNRK